MQCVVQLVYYFNVVGCKVIELYLVGGWVGINVEGCLVDVLYIYGFEFGYFEVEGVDGCIISSSYIVIYYQQVVNVYFCGDFEEGIVILVVKIFIVIICYCNRGSVVVIIKCKLGIGIDYWVDGIILYVVDGVFFVIVSEGVLNSVV